MLCEEGYKYFKSIKFFSKLFKLNLNKNILYFIKFPQIILVYPNALKVIMGTMNQGFARIVLILTA